MRLILLAAALLALPGAASALQRIEGRVWDVTEAERLPLANARITLLQMPQATLLGFTRTDAGGRFAFEGEVDGPVRVQFARNGFAPSSGDDYRNADCSSGCGPFDLELVRAGVITGRVLDDLGEPLARAAVRLWCDGSASPRANATTDDRGRYRLAGLRPGLTCRLDAIRNGRFARSVELQTEPFELETEAAMERTIPIVMHPTGGDPVRVSGVVQGLDEDSEVDSEVDRVLVATKISGGPRRGMQRAELDSNNHFEIEEMALGEYIFRLQSRSGRRRGSMEFLGRHNITSATEGLVLRPQQPWRVAGRVEFDGPAPTTPVVIYLSSAERRVGIGFEARPPDFTFDRTRVDASPGEFQAKLRDPDRFIASIEAADRTYPPHAVVLDQQSSQSLVIRLSDEFASISGRVKADRDGNPAPHYQVALRSTAAGEADRVQSMQTDQQGRFRFARVQPGEYRIAAWGELAADAVRSQAPWDAAGPAARVFPVEAGAEIEIDLTAVPSEAGP